MHPAYRDGQAFLKRTSKRLNKEKQPQFRDQAGHTCVWRKSQKREPKEAARATTCSALRQVGSPSPSM